MKIPDREFCVLYNEITNTGMAIKRELEILEYFRKRLEDLYNSDENEEEKAVVFVGEYAFCDPKKLKAKVENGTTSYPPITDKFYIR